MLTVGVDLAKRKSQFAVVDESGKVIAECKLPNHKETVQKFLRALPGKVQVGCETCTNTYWLVELVEEVQMPIFVGHALNLRLIAQSRIKTDKIDARVIVELLRVGFFPTIAIPPKEVRQVRERLRGRIQVSRTLAQAKNRLHGEACTTGTPRSLASLAGVSFRMRRAGSSKAPKRRRVGPRAGPPAQHAPPTRRSMRPISRRTVRHRISSQQSAAPARRAGPLPWTKLCTLRRG